MADTVGVQIPMVSRATGLAPDSRGPIKQHQDAQLGFLGSSYIDVLRLRKRLPSYTDLWVAMNSELTGADEATDVVEAAGHFRIYLGAAAGVGKTYAMLNEGRRRATRGTDVVIGFVEPRSAAHGGADPGPGDRAPEDGGVSGHHLPRDGPRRCARRHPQVALVDELAHTNVPGSGRHRKRWEEPGTPGRRHRRHHDGQHPAPGEPR